MPLLPNAYWLAPGRIACGEYPGARTPDAARARLRTLLDAGVRTFVDLTEPNELVPYDETLHLLATDVVDYVRLPIRDLDVPHTAADMSRTLDVVDHAAASRPAVYVYCWGGIGRTGTVAGYWLRRHGASGDAALDQVARLFATMEKAPFRGDSPETDAQRDYVRRWSEV